MSEPEAPKSVEAISQPSETPEARRKLIVIVLILCAASILMWWFAARQKEGEVRPVITPKKSPA